MSNVKQSNPAIRTPSVPICTNYEAGVINSLVPFRQPIKQFRFMAPIMFSFRLQLKRCREGNWIYFGLTNSMLRVYGTSPIIQNMFSSITKLQNVTILMIWYPLSIHLHFHDVSTM